MVPPRIAAQRPGWHDGAGCAQRCPLSNRVREVERMEKPGKPTEAHIPPREAGVKFSTPSNNDERRISQRLRRRAETGSWPRLVRMGEQLTRDAISTSRDKER